MLAIGAIGAVAESTLHFSTTNAVNTSATGSGFIVEVVCQMSTSSGPMSCVVQSDTFDNAFTHIAQESADAGDGYYTIDTFYCGSGTGGANHTATIQFTDNGPINAQVTLIEVTGAPFTYDQAGSKYDPYYSGSPYAGVSLTVTPPSSGALLLSSAVMGPSGTASEGTGFTVQEQNGLGNFVLGTATNIVTASATYTPSWSVASGYEALTSLKSFLGPDTTPVVAPRNQWLPFQLACRLRCLRQGSLNVGNTQQNIENLWQLAYAQAFSPSNPPWALWRTALNTAYTPSNLMINVPLVPGYVAPSG